MSTFNHILESAESTVVAEYVPEKRTAKTYQSESELEKEFIANLIAQGYEHLPIHEENDLKKNLRQQLELLNDYKFSDSEWERFFRENIADANDGIVEKTRRVQTDHVQAFRQDNGATKNIHLFDKKNIHHNRLQVINQYQENSGTHQTRYDVTILVNGLPLVHIELKRRGASLKEAFNQIDRYQRESFWAASGLYEYIQIFVISNGTETKYYSNTTRNHYVKELSGEGRKRSKKTSDSFEFTSYWADGNNKIIPDLVDFTKTFFSKHSLLNIISKYCVFDVDNKLLVMRPYQIVATERILNRIEIATNYKKLGSVDAGGYIWHTTGSGKTLTSFKAAQLATKIPDVEKVIFVVDRKDLDYQTIKEYDRFEKGAANGNNSTRELEQNLRDPRKKILVTTIQKLNIFVRRNKQHEIYSRHVVIIFDECHRSQFGEMHTVITKAFKKYNLFGFTGTPIFAQNANNNGNPFFRTTAQAFGDKLHTYTIVDAINDGNVLPFHIDYLRMMHGRDDIDDKDIPAIDREKAMSDPRRIESVTQYILEHFDQKTKRNSFYKLKGQRMAGFNSIFAVSNIALAKLYFQEFKKQLTANGRKLNVAIIFSFAPNENLDDMVDDEDLTVETLDQSSRDFLEDAIQTYNQTFNTDFDTSSDKFQNYYKDLSMRVKNREVDLLIVVNMFLTGFDATTLNTLWVDKDLRMHGLIQAFSRTNRILNSVKTFGNIVCFRNLQQKVDEAVGLFGDKEASGIVLLRSYDDYINGYDKGDEHHVGYNDLITELRAEFPPQDRIIGEAKQDEFIKLFGKILRLRNILSSFDQFTHNDVLAERELQDYQSIYLDLYEQKRHKGDIHGKEVINDDLVFEIELIRQAEVNVDYILALVLKFHQSNCEDREVLSMIDRAVDSSLQLRSKKQLIHDFINTVTNIGEIHDDWQRFVNAQRISELDQIIEQYHLKNDGTYRLIENAFRDGVFKTTGVDIDRILPPMSRFDIERKTKKATIIARLRAFFDKFFGAI